MAKPKSPFYLDGEAVQPRDELDIDPMRREVYEAERLSKANLSGPLGAPYMHPDGPQSEERYAEHLEQQEKIRACKGGLPDSSLEMPPKAVGSKPFKF